MAKRTTTRPPGRLTNDANRPTEPASGDDILDIIAAAVSAQTADEYFRATTRYLAQALGADLVLIAELVDGDAGRVRTISACLHGKAVDRFDYGLIDSPCESVPSGGLCIYPENVRELFPRDEQLKALDAESYIGTPLTSGSDEVLGLLVVADRKPLRDVERAERLVRIFAARAGAELVRKKAEDALRASEARFRHLTALSSDWYWEQDSDYRFTMITRNVDGMRRFATKDGVGKTRWELPYLDVTEEQWRQHRAVLDARRPFRDLVLKRRDAAGNIRYSSINGDPIFDAGGGFKGYRGTGRDITELKEAEDALRESQERLELALRASNIGLWSWDVRTDEVYFSPRWKAQLGYEDHEIPNAFEEWEKRLHPDDRERILASIQSFLANPHPHYEHEFRLRHKDGSYRWILARADLFNDFAGRPCRMMGCHIDITQRRRTEMDLQAAVGRVQLLTSQIPAILWTTDTELRFTSSVGAGLKTLGSAPNRAIGKSLQEYFGACDPGYRPLAAHRAALRGESQQFEFPWKDNVYQVSVKPLRGAQEAIIGTIGLALDITDRKRAEDALRRSEESFRLMFANNPLPMWVHDTETLAFLAVNDAAVRCYGYAREAFLTMMVKDVCFAGEIPVLLRSLTEGEAQRDLVPEVSRHVKKDGSVMSVEVTSHALTFAGLPARLVVVNDVTERKHTENLMARLGRILDHTSNEIYVFDAETLRFTQANKGACRNLGYSLDELKRLTPADLKPVYDHQSFEELIRPLRAGEQDSITFETVHRRKDGTHYPVEVRLQLSHQESPPVFVAVVQDIAERKASQDALRESERLLRTVMDALPVGVWVTDREGNIVSANPAGQRIWGGAQCVGIEKHGEYKGWWHETGEPIAANERAVARAISGGESVINEVIDIEISRGKRRTILNSAVPIHDQTGQIIGAIVVDQDITDRVCAEQELRVAHVALEAAHGQLSAIIENTPTVAMQGCDQRGTIAFWNRASETLFGYTAADIIGKRLGDLIFPPETAAEFEELMGKVLASGEPAPNREWTTTTATGDLRWVMTSIFPIHFADNQSLVICMEVDITARKRSEEKMRKLSSAIQQTADAVMITDCTGAIEYVNEAFEKMTGYSSSDVVGKSPNIIKSGMHEPEFYGRIWKTIRSGETFRDVFINRKKNGDIYYEEKTITPLKDDQGNITNFISTGKDITERMQTQERLQFLTHHDALTSLPNRLLFMDRVSHALIRAHWHQRVIAVMFLDLDRFKTINDSLGHNVGDHFLQLIATRLVSSVREGDTVARVGGDEFAILLEDVAHAEDVSAIAHKIITAFSRPYTLHGHELFITTSIGVSLYPTDATDAMMLLKRADAAMYRAKELGKNNYQFYSADMGAMDFERLTMESSLRHALKRNEFRLLYQPQVDLRTGRIIGTEALLRWQHPEFGLIAPLQFITLAEETGMIGPIGEWVTRTACQQLLAWRDAGFGPLRMAINVSGRQFNEAVFIDLIGRLLKEINLDPQLLELEITESVIMDNAQVTIEKLRALHAMGVRFAIDDFGTGYSSLSYLRRFAINTLKIDKSFISDIASDQDDAEIVKSIIAMAHSLKLDVIAEGVESNEILEFLRRYGCDGVQGHLFSHPLSAEEMTELLARGNYL